MIIATLPFVADGVAVAERTISSQPPTLKKDSSRFNPKKQMSPSQNSRKRLCLACFDQAKEKAPPGKPQKRHC